MPPARLLLRARGPAAVDADALADALVAAAAAADSPRSVSSPMLRSSRSRLEGSCTHAPTAIAFSS